MNIDLQSILNVGADASVEELEQALVLFEQKENEAAVELTRLLDERNNSAARQVASGNVTLPRETEWIEKAREAHENTKRAVAQVTGWLTLARMREEKTDRPATVIRAYEALHEAEKAAADLVEALTKAREAGERMSTQREQALKLINEALGPLRGSKHIRLLKFDSAWDLIEFHSELRSMPTDSNGGGKFLNNVRTIHRRALAPLGTAPKQAA